MRRVVIGVSWIGATLAGVDGVPIEFELRRDFLQSVRKREMRSDAAVADDGPKHARGGDGHGGRREIGARGGVGVGVGGDEGENDGEHGGRDVLNAVSFLLATSGGDVDGFVFYHQSTVGERRVFDGTGTRGTTFHVTFGLLSAFLHHGLESCLKRMNRSVVRGALTALGGAKEIDGHRAGGATTGASASRILVWIL